MLRRSNLSLLLLGLSLSFPGLTQAQYAFTPVSVPGASYTAVNRLSPHSAVGQFDDSSGNTHGFLLNKGLFTPIDIPGALATTANGVNASGSIAGAFLTNKFYG